MINKQSNSYIANRFWIRLGHRVVTEIWAQIGSNVESPIWFNVRDTNSIQKTIDMVLYDQ